MGAHPSTSTSDPPDAREATLLNADLVLHVLLMHAKSTRGWCQELASLALVCTVWREALRAADKRLSEWCEFVWVLEDFPRLCAKPFEGHLVPPTSGSSAYDWALVVEPRAVRHTLDVE